MKAEIDQSGKLEHLNTHTVISMANHSSGSVYLSVSEKVKLVKFLRKSIVSRSDLVIVVFSTLIFILLIKFGKNLSKVDIDEEYSNKDKFIKETISKLFVSSKIKNKPDINFIRIGKLSVAHKLCWSIHRKKLKNKAITITCEDVLKLWRL